METEGNIIKGIRYGGVISIGFWVLLYCLLKILILQ